MFCKKGVLKNFANLTEKTPVLEPLFNKVAGLNGCNAIKKRLVIRVFSCEYFETFKNTYLEEHLRTAASLLTGICTCFTR